MRQVREHASAWEYDVVSLGYPGSAGPDGPTGEAGNLGPGWVGYDFADAFQRPVRIVNDAAMQALGAYDGGRMFFLGLGTGLGSTLVAGRVIVRLELGCLVSRSATRSPTGSAKAAWLEPGSTAGGRPSAKRASSCAKPARPTTWCWAAATRRSSIHCPPTPGAAATGRIHRRCPVVGGVGGTSRRAAVRHLAGGLRCGYRALATDFDGTIAHDGVVDDATIAALERARAAGLCLLLVTGRELPRPVRHLRHRCACSIGSSPRTAP